MTYTLPNLDTLDKTILTNRIKGCQSPYPNVGDFVRFPDQSLARIAHVWPDVNNLPETIQLENGNGSYYLGNRYLSFSGGLHPGIPASGMTRTAETKPGLVWFFHHDEQRAHNAVFSFMDFPIWEAMGER